MQSKQENESYLEIKENSTSLEKRLRILERRIQKLKLNNDKLEDEIYICKRRMLRLIKKIKS